MEEDIFIEKIRGLVRSGFFHQGYWEVEKRINVGTRLSLLLTSKDSYINGKLATTITFSRVWPHTSDDEVIKYIELHQEELRRLFNDAHLIRFECSSGLLVKFVN